MTNAADAARARREEMRPKIEAVARQVAAEMHDQSGAPALVTFGWVSVDDDSYVNRPREYTAGDHAREVARLFDVPERLVIIDNPPPAPITRRPWWRRHRDRLIRQWHRTRRNQP